MKIFFSILIFILLFVSCSGEKDSPDERFIETYKEVLVIREMYPMDTAKANKKVDSVFEANDYTEPEFRKDYFKYAKNSKEFVNMIDSLRKSIRFEYDSLKKSD